MSAPALHDTCTCEPGAPCAGIDCEHCNRVHGCPAADVLDAADLEPGSSTWRRYVTASKVAAILGVSPYESPRSMWHLMRGDVAPSEATRVQSRGHYLEPAILAWWRDQHPEFVTVERSVLATRPDVPWAAANLDARAWPARRSDGPVVVEAKSSDRDDEWGRPGTDEVPPYYAAQAMWAMHLDGALRAYIPIITSHLEFREYVVDYDPDLAEAIEARCAAFYASLTDGTPPPLDDHVATYESLRRVHPDIDVDAEVELSPAAAREYVEAEAALKAAKARATAAKSVVLDALGSARRATCAGQVIAQRQNTAAGTPALYPARKAVDLDALPQPTKETAA